MVQPQQDQVGLQRVKAARALGGAARPPCLRSQQRHACVPACWLSPQGTGPDTLPCCTGVQGCSQPFSLSPCPSWSIPAGATVELPRGSPKGGCLTSADFTTVLAETECREAVQKTTAATFANVLAAAECRELAPDIASTAIAKAVAEAEWHEAAAQRTAHAFAVFLAAASAASAAAAAAPAPVSMPRPACSSQRQQEAAAAVNAWRCGSPQRSSAFDSLQGHLVLLWLHR